MAIQTRLYVLRGPSQRDINTFIDPTVIAVDRVRTPVVTLEYDDAMPGIVETMDGYMEEQWGLDAGTPTPDRLPGYIDGLVPSWSSVTTVQISSGRCKAKNGKDDLILPAPADIDITVAGIGGLDTGVEAANQWYYLYVIGDSNGVNPTAVILSASQNAPTFPVGYDIARRVGTVRNQGGDFRPFQVFGTGTFREVQYRDSLLSRQRLVGGAATVVTNVGCSPVIPNTSSLARFQIIQRGLVDLFIYDDVTQPLADYQRLVMPGAAIIDEIRVSGTRDIAYANAAVGGLAEIYVTGYQESV